ncbi:MAG TPA: hypothetical protein VFO85_01235 [Vicinamibacteria bacterium]|nr:hypothetical protein [Vicinamibacteria bacterium]
MRLEVGGAAEPVEGGLMVRLEVANRGDSAAARVDVAGDLFGHHAEAALPGGVAAGAAQSVWLHFPVGPPRPGVHALALHLRYPGRSAAEPASQRAYLLLALGARADSPLDVWAEPASFETSGALAVQVRSRDGAGHRVRLRVLAPAGLNALGEPDVEVPAQGAATAVVPLIRTGPSRREAHEVLVLAATEDGGVATTAVARATVALVPHVPVLPRLRPFLAATGALLLAAAVAAEVRARWRAR